MAIPFCRRSSRQRRDSLKSSARSFRYAKNHARLACGNGKKVLPQRLLAIYLKGFMIKKIRVAVLCGGPSAEYGVSLKTAAQVMKNLDKRKFSARFLKIGKDGKWPMAPRNLRKNFDVVFIAMHGEYGEDGRVQKILERVKIPYTGSGPVASRLGLDKARSAAVFQRAGLLVPRFVRNKMRHDFFYPVVVKPNDRGSSVGITIVKSPKNLASAVAKARKFSRDILIQEYIHGREFTCGVLEVGGRPQPFLPTEIIPRASIFFDYKAKYAKGGSQEITPPHLPKNKIAEIKKIALAAHRAIGARGFSRTDVILSSQIFPPARGGVRGGGRFYVLEINTIPGMTEASLLPKAARASGISFKKLLTLIIEVTI